MKNKEEQEQMFFHYLIRKIDKFGQPLQWYIGKNETYQTVTGGIKTIVIISISLFFLLYSLIIFFRKREGSFIMYDITYSELNDTNIDYFDDFEIFLFFKTSSTMILNMDIKDARIYLAQFNGEDNSIISKYPLEECNNDYFVNNLGFSDFVKSNLEKTYCINKDIYKDKKINFSLSQKSPLGKTTNTIKLIFTKNCDNDICSEEENNKFLQIYSYIEEVRIFIKTLTPNPLNINNPLQNEVISFTLSSNIKGTIVYLKKYNITTQSSVIPHIFGSEKINFIAYDYHQEVYNLNNNNKDISYYLEFVLSSKVSYLDRYYQQLDTILANFIGIYDSLEIVTSFLTFIFESFSKEFFIYNFLLKDKLFNKKKKIISNPPPKIYSNNNNNVLFKTKDKELLNLNNNNKTKKYLNNNFYTENNLIIQSQKQLTEKESKDEILQSKNQNIKEEKIYLNVIKSLWFNILMIFNIKKSKYPDIQNSLEKTQLTQDFFDVSIYINLVLDMMRLKKIIFNQQQLKLFEFINFSSEEIKNYLNKDYENQEIISNKNIFYELEKIKSQKNSKMTDNIISILNEQINV